MLLAQSVKSATDFNHGETKATEKYRNEPAEWGQGPELPFDGLTVGRSGARPQFARTWREASFDRRSDQGAFAEDFYYSQYVLVHLLARFDCVVSQQIGRVISRHDFPPVELVYAAADFADGDV